LIGAFTNRPSDGIWTYSKQKKMKVYIKRSFQMKKAPMFDGKQIFTMEP